jgi:hypothetical protein
MRFALHLTGYMLCFACCVLALSCEKTSSECKCQGPPAITKSAKIVFTGNLEVDGCDWLVQVDSNQFYRADSLPSAFKQNDLNVTISYWETKKEYKCGWFKSIPVIQVKNIK